jgi:hypothetical protein
MFRYEHRLQRPASPRRFIRRVVTHFVAVFGLIATSLAIGMAGYEAFEGLSRLDAFLNASMLLGGMGPIHTPVTPDGKLFAGLYALYAGLVFIAASGLLVAPVFHRVLHNLHWTESRDAD